VPGRGVSLSTKMPATSACAPIAESVGPCPYTTARAFAENGLSEPYPLNDFRLRLGGGAPDSRKESLCSNRRIRVRTVFFNAREPVCSGKPHSDQALPKAIRDRGLELPVSAGDGLAGFLVGGAAALGFALIPELFALGDRQFDLHLPVLESTCG